MFDGSEPKHKLPDAAKEEIVELIAMHRGSMEIVRYLEEEYGITVNNSNISYYRKAKEDKINERRRQLDKKLLTIPVANKFTRVEKLQKLVEDLEKKLWTVTGHVIVNNPKHNPNDPDDKEPAMIRVPKMKGNHQAIVDVLRLVKEEVEPLRVAFTDTDGKDKDLTTEINIVNMQFNQIEPEKRRRMLELIRESDKVTNGRSNGEDNAS